MFFSLRPQMLSFIPNHPTFVFPPTSGFIRDDIRSEQDAHGRSPTHSMMETSAFSGYPYANDPGSRSVRTSPACNSPGSWGPWNVEKRPDYSPYGVGLGVSLYEDPTPDSKPPPSPSISAGFGSNASSFSTEEVTPKVEELDDNEDIKLTEPENPNDDPQPSSMGSPVHVPRKRGRPRKHPLPAPSTQLKITKGRSKTGCITCRRRKKKCDETKPAYILPSY